MILNSQMKLQVDKAMARAAERAQRLTALSALAENGVWFSQHSPQVVHITSKCSPRRSDALSWLQ